jgi:acetyl-CoA C-acetyltransferase
MMNSLDQDPIVIVSAARTPLGSFQGAFSSVTATELGSVAIKAAVERAGLKPEQVEEVIMGCVLPAGLGQAPARQATLGAGLPLSVGATTVNKVCGSGMRAMMTAHDALLADSAQVMVAGGMESMTNAPYLLAKARAGYRIGHSQMFDHMMMDGLEDAYDKGRSMGTFGEECAEKYQFSREAQDAFAVESVKRAQQAIMDGSFKDEIAAVKVSNRAGDTLIDQDEGPGKIKTEKIPSLKPAFKKDGTLTAASSSSINDGAAALVMMRASTATKLGLTPIAKMCGHTTFAHAPNWFTTAPITCIERLLKKNDWSVDSVDLWEINEAFAVVPMAAMHDLQIPHEKINVHGGACALGHPIGASGARIVVTLLHALKKYGLKRGVASLCIGGGEATAIGVELLDQ